MKDALLTKSTALPAAGANNNSVAFDLGARGFKQADFPADGVELIISWPALPSLANTKVVTFTVQDSADNTSFSPIGLTKATPAGSGGAGIPAGNIRYKLPRTVRQYLRVNQAVDADGGDNTAQAIEVSIVFGDL